MRIQLVKPAQARAQAQRLLSTCRNNTSKLSSGHASFSSFPSFSSSGSSITNTYTNSITSTNTYTNTNTSTRQYTTHSQLPEEHQMIHEMCRKFADEELAPNAGKWDQEHAFPKDAVSQLVSVSFISVLYMYWYIGIGILVLVYWYIGILVM
jgi:hypothetical protein